MTPLFQTYFGKRGCIKTAPSNKAARLLGGKTMHSLSKLYGDQLHMHALRVNEGTMKGLASSLVPAGGLIKDEWSQSSGPLEHGLALRATYARSSTYNLRLAEYAAKSQTYGAIPMVASCGDELQLPPVPESSSLLAPPTGSQEHAAGVKIFAQQDFCYRLTTMMRFDDELLVGILAKMRQPDGCELTAREWDALQATEVSSLRAKRHGAPEHSATVATLEGTEDW